MNANVGLNSWGRDLTLLLLLYIGYFYFLRKSSQTLSGKKLKTLSIVFFISALPTLFFSNTEIGVIYGYLSVLSVPVGISLGKKLCNFHSTCSHPDLILSVILIPAFVGCIWSFVMSGSIVLFEAGRDYIFAIVIFTPLLYYYKSPVLRFSLIFLFLYCTIVSTKRTALICVALSLVLYMLINISKIRNVNFKTILLGIFFSVSLQFVIQSFIIGSAVDAFDITIERMTNLDDKSNEERTNIYETVFAHIESSSPFEYIWGHGYNAVSKQILGHPAHNDFLEIAYDFGVITLVIYVLIYFLLFLYIIKKWLSRKIMFSDSFYMINVLFLLLVLIMANCFISNTIYMITCMISIGWALEYTEIKTIKYGK